MPKFRVWDPEEDPEVLYFRLIQDTEYPALVACDKDGVPLDNGHICSVFTGGKLYLYTGIKVEGIAKDAEGKIVLA